MSKLFNPLKRKWLTWRLYCAHKAHIKACAMLDYWRVEEKTCFDGFEIVEAKGQVEYWKAKRSKSFDQILATSSKLRALKTK